MFDLLFDQYPSPLNLILVNNLSHIINIPLCCTVCLLWIHVCIEAGYKLHSESSLLHFSWRWMKLQSLQRAHLETSCRVSTYLTWMNMFTCTQWMQTASVMLTQWKQIVVLDYWRWRNGVKYSIAWKQEYFTFCFFFLLKFLCKVMKTIIPLHLSWHVEHNI